MKIYLDQIPDGVSLGEYPPDTEFILDDETPKRDPITNRIIWPKRSHITPEEARKQQG